MKRYTYFYKRKKFKVGVRTSKKSNNFIFQIYKKNPH